MHQQPPTAVVPSTDETGWKTITLTRTVDDHPTAKASSAQPVAPPRKKRTSMLSLKNAGVVKNGFKDVFGSDTPRRYSIDSIHNSKRYRERSVDVEVPVRNSVSCHDVCDESFADFSREISPKDGSSARKVLPKVGNKKSDKLLGENLSELSDGQVRPDAVVAEPDHDPIEQFVEEHVAEKKTVVADQKEATHNAASDSEVAMKEKAALLMNFLDKYSHEEDYSNREPVVEEMIVPRKKKTGHICDEDEFHKHFHAHEKGENEKLREDLPETALEEMIVTPKKPRRDLAIYRKSLENVSTTSAEPSSPVVAPVRRKKSLNREDMPSPPPRPPKIGIVDAKSQENILSMSPTKDLELEPPKLQLNLSSEKVKGESASDTTTTPPSSPIVPPRNHHDRPEVMDSPTSPGSMLPGRVSQDPEGDDRRSHGKHGKKSPIPPLSFNQDAMSKMKHRILEFQMSQEYVMEDISNENDGSNNVNPTKTLDPVTKKISVASMPSPIVLEVPIEDPIKVTGTLSASSPVSRDTDKSELESLSASDTLSNDGSGGSSKTIVQCVVQKKIEDKKDVTDLPAEENLFNKSSILLAEKTVENILTSDVNIQILSNVLDDMYDKAVLDEFQTYLETEGTDFNDNKKMPGDHSDALIRDLKLRRAEKAAADSTPSSPVIEEVELPEPVIKKSPKAEKPPKKKKKRTKKQPVVEEDQVSLESISDDGYTNLVRTASKEDITNNTLLAVTQSRPRRESICDVDNWFNNHIDPASSTLNVDNLRDVRMMRRGSDFGVGYHTGSTFPFGRSRQVSESSDFFENHKFSKSNDNLKGSNTSLNKDSGSNGSLNKDHSSLLRFVVPTSPLAFESSPSPAAVVVESNKSFEEIKNSRNKPIPRSISLSPPTIEIVVVTPEGDNCDTAVGDAGGVAKNKKDKE